MTPTRRGFLKGLIAAGVCAPAIVRPGLLMPVKAIKQITLADWAALNAQRYCATGNLFYEGFEIHLSTRLPQFAWRSVYLDIPYKKTSDI